MCKNGVLNVKRESRVCGEGDTYSEGGCIPTSICRKTDKQDLQSETSPSYSRDEMKPFFFDY